MIKKTTSSLLFVFIYLLVTQDAIAQNIKITQPENTGPKVSGDASKFVQGVWTSIVTMIYSVAILAFIIMIVWGALDIILSGGNKDKIAAGRKRITTAIIGITVLAFAFFIARVVGDIIGIKINPSSPIKIPSLFGA